jgi:CheY-like chemotaxis protein
VREHAFERSSRPRRRVKAPVGIGQRLCDRQAAQRLLHLYSELGKGTEFKIYLPVQESAFQAGDTQDTQRISHLGKSGTYLLPKITKSSRKSVSAFWRKLSIRFLSARDGQEAFEMFMERREEIDLILTDVVMPRLGGQELRDRVREVDPTMPILFSSGYSENTVHTRFIRDAFASDPETLRFERTVAQCSHDSGRFGGSSPILLNQNLRLATQNSPSSLFGDRIFEMRPHFEHLTIPPECALLRLFRIR